MCHHLAVITCIALIKLVLFLFFKSPEKMNSNEGSTLLRCTSRFTGPWPWLWNSKERSISKCPVHIQQLFAFSLIFIPTNRVSAVMSASSYYFAEVWDLICESYGKAKHVNVSINLPTLFKKLFNPVLAICFQIWWCKIHVD